MTSCAKKPIIAGKTQQIMEVKLEIERNVSEFLKFFFWKFRIKNSCNPRILGTKCIQQYYWKQYEDYFNQNVKSSSKSSNGVFPLFKIMVKNSLYLSWNSTIGPSVHQDSKSNQAFINIKNTF